MSLGAGPPGSLTSSPAMQLSDLGTGCSDCIPVYFPSDKHPPGMQESGENLSYVLSVHVQWYGGELFCFQLFLELLKKFKCWY